MLLHGIHRPQRGRTHKICLQCGQPKRTLGKTPCGLPTVPYQGKMAQPSDELLSSASSAARARAEAIRVRVQSQRGESTRTHSRLSL